MNQPGGLDVVLAQGSLTASGAHPQGVVEAALARGDYVGYTKETLRDTRYFPIDSEPDLKRKWPLIIGQHPGFIKTFLWMSDEFERRRMDPSVSFGKGLDPRLLPRIVAKAHAEGLRVSTHVVNAADFHNALMAHVDIVAHIPRFLSTAPYTPIAGADARLAARRKTIVITTLAAHLRQGVDSSDRDRARGAQQADLRLLIQSGVPVVIGSDDVNDTSVGEIFYLHGLGVLDNLALLKMWMEATPTAIFPGRRIGRLREGYEASFLALEGDPIEDLNNVRRIKYRFKQGVLLPQ
jgi:predicted amidohydrolase YtcJ